MTTKLQCMRECQDAYELFCSYGFTVAIASSASTFVYNEGRSKKAKEIKFLRALWYAHNKHNATTTVDDLKTAIGIREKCKLQPEEGRIVIRSIREQIEFYIEKGKLSFLSDDIVKECLRIASLADEDDGLPVLVPNSAVAVIRYAAAKHNYKIKREVLCDTFHRPIASVAQAIKCLEQKLSDTQRETHDADHL